MRLARIFWVAPHLMAVGLCAASTAAQAQQRSNLTVSNRSGQPIAELYVSNTRTSTWGDDRLGTATIAAGRTFRLRLADGCLYDLQVVYQDGRVEERMRANICRVPLQVFTAAEAHAVPQEPTQAFDVENRTVQPISEVAVSTASNADPTENLLSAPLYPGASQSVTYRGECHADVRVTFDNKSVEQRHLVDLCSPGTVVVVAPGWTTLDETPPPVAPTDPITIANHSGHRIAELFIYPPDGLHGDDRLGMRVLDDGAETTVALDRGGACVFTLRAVFEGAVPDQVQDGIDFCPRRALTVSP